MSATSRSSRHVFDFLVLPLMLAFILGATPGCELLKEWLSPGPGPVDRYIERVDARIAHGEPEAAAMRAELPQLATDVGSATGDVTELLVTAAGGSVVAAHFVSEMLRGWMARRRAALLPPPPPTVPVL